MIITIHRASDGEEKQRHRLETCPFTKERHTSREHPLFQKMTLITSTFCIQTNTPTSPSIFHSLACCCCPHGKIYKPNSSYKHLYSALQ